MNLESQIAKLLRLKRKKELYELLIQNLSLENDPEEETKFPGLLAEFVGEVTTFASEKIKSLDGGKEESGFKPLKPKKVPHNPVTPTPLDEGNKPPKAPKDSNLEVDPLSFMLKHRHLHNQKVQLRTGAGTDLVEGKVVRINYPNLLVEVNGTFLSVPPSDLII